MNNKNINRKSFLGLSVKSLLAVSFLSYIPAKIFGKEKIKVQIHKDAVKRNK